MSTSKRTASVGESAVVAAVYLGAMALWIYLVLDANVDDAPTWLLGPVALLHVGVGYATGRWVTLLLAPATVFLAMPAGYPGSDFGDPLPLAAVIMFAAPFGLVLLAIGVLWRRLGRRARA